MPTPTWTNQAELALSRLAGVSGLVPSVDWLLYSPIRREALLTSKIEGTQATLTDLFDEEAGLPVDNTDDLEEVTNYLRALRLVRDNLRDPNGLPISTRLLCEAHRVLLDGVRGTGKQPGELRHSQNSIGGRVWLTRLSDIGLGTSGGAGEVTGFSRMCVHRNDTGIYSITATSANADGAAFQVAGAGALLRYQVSFRVSSGNVFADIQSGQRLKELRGQHNALFCLFQYDARIDVSFAEGDLQATPPGTYQDVITLLVEPG